MNGKHPNMDRNVSMSQNGSSVAQPVWPADAGGDYSEDSVFSVDFAAIGAAIWRSLFWLAGIVVCVLVIGVVLRIVSTPLFRATPTVQIDQSASKLLGPEEA